MNEEPFGPLAFVTKCQSIEEATSEPNRVH
jgi:acyl-CoA reductase-like NAD-dependent aldehyde dehydrogenase